MPREGTGFQNVHRSGYWIYLNRITCHPMNAASLPEIPHVTYILENGFRVFQRGSFSGLQQHHVPLQKIPLGLSFAKTQVDREVGVGLGPAVNRCEVLSHPALVDKPCSTRSLYRDNSPEMKLGSSYKC